MPSALLRYGSTDDNSGPLAPRKEYLTMGFLINQVEKFFADKNSGMPILVCQCLLLNSNIKLLPNMVTTSYSFATQADKMRAKLGCLLNI